MFKNVTNFKNIVKGFLKSVSYIILVNFRAYMREKMTKNRNFQFSKNHSKLCSRVISDMKSLNFEPGSTQIESFRAY